MREDLIEKLYIKHHSAVFAYVFSLSKNKEIAEDIVSHGFEKAMVTVDDSIPNFRFWLLKVCKNLWFDYLRKEKRRADKTVEEMNLESNHNVFNEVAGKMENAKLYRAINKLNDSDREIILLFYFSHLSVSEVSKFLRIKEVNTKVKLHRARLKLRKIMEVE